MSEIRNAMVRSVSLGFEDHGFLMIWVHLDYGGSGQGFGGYALGRRDRSVGTHHCGEWVRRLLLVFEVDTWDKIVGKPCRAEIDNGLVRRIGHLLKDKWFDPKEIDSDA